MSPERVPLNYSDDNSLYIIHEWLQNRLDRGLANRGSSSELDDGDDNPSKIRQKFVEEKIYRIINALKLLNDDESKLVAKGNSELVKDKYLLATVRRSFCQNQLYLRPVYSEPGCLRDYLVDPALQSPFSFNLIKLPKQRIPLPFTGLQILDRKDNDHPHEVFGALHCVKEYRKPSLGDNSDNPEFAFAPRIDKFWSRLQQANPEKFGKLCELSNKKMSSEKKLFCFFAGRNKIEKNGSQDVPIELDHIVAIYFETTNDFTEHPSALRSKIEKATKIARSLFDGIDIISSIDSNLFKMEGLQLVANLLPTFSKSTIAPADKVALAIEMIKNHLTQHLVGRQADGDNPEVFYLTATFEQFLNKDTKKISFYPHLEIYPHIYKINEHRTASYQIAHKKLPSVTKLLLNLYLQCEFHKIVFGKKIISNDETIQEDWSPVLIHEDFTNLFTTESLKTPDLDIWKSDIWKESESDLIHMVSHETNWNSLEGKVSPWVALNRSPNLNRQNNSIVAVIVEGEDVPTPEGGTPQKTFPHGVFAIESTYVDAFSDDDIDGLRTVFGGLAALIRQINHRNSPLDYRTSLTTAFEDFLPLERKGLSPELGKRLIFAVQKIDGEEFDFLCKEISHAIAGMDEADKVKALVNYSLTPKSFEKILQIQSLCPGRKDHAVDEETGNRVIQERVERLREWLREDPQDNSLSEDPAEESYPENVIEFLEACTENYHWANFLSSFSRAIGHRVNKEIPTFNFMAPGYSAWRMFIAVLQGEFQQVVKLSIAKKLEKEKYNYSQFVRYKVVNAARIPMNGFAFDTRGIEGRNKGSGKEIQGTAEGMADVPYGALVSDLVTGLNANYESVLTLMACIANSIIDPVFADPKIFDIAHALKTFFSTDLILWKLPNDAISEYKSPIEAARSLLRLPVNYRILTDSDYQLSSTEDNTIDSKTKRKNDFIRTHQAFRAIQSTANPNPDIDYFKNTWDPDSWSKHNGERRSVIGKNDLKEILTIIHGDMNARNLTWAAGLKCFFMIDFEHVGHGFEGLDQLRLMVNIVVELFGEIFKDDSNFRRCYKELFKEIDNITTYISKLSKGLFNCRTTIDGIVDYDEFNSIQKIGLCSIFHELSSPLRNHSLSVTKETSNYWSRFWGYVLFCSALKEFHYSCKNLKKDLLNVIINEAKLKKLSLLDATSEDLYEFLKSVPVFAFEDDREREKFSLYFRHTIAAKILYSTCKK